MAIEINGDLKQKTRSTLALGVGRVYSSSIVCGN